MWKKEYYRGQNGRTYIQYANGDGYIIRQTHSKNIFTGREMGHANQVWKIYRIENYCLTEVNYALTFREAKATAERMMQKGA